MLKSTRSLLMLATAGTWVACGDAIPGLVDERFQGEPLAVLQGTLRIDDASGLTGDVSLALLWDAASLAPLRPIVSPRRPEAVCTGEPDPRTSRAEVLLGANNAIGAGRAWISQSVSIEASFPARFEMPLYQFPPAGALVDLAENDFGEGLYAAGQLAVYIDTNANGVLDLPSAGRPGDEILALNYDLGITYLDGIIQPEFDVVLQVGEVPNIPAGLSIWTADIQTNPDLTTTGLTWVPSFSFRRYASIEAGVDITIPTSSRDRKHAEYRACTSVVLRHEYGGAVPVDFDVFDPGYTNCASDGLSTWSGTEPEVEVDETCVLTRRVFLACLEPEAPVPDHWPCQ